MQEIAATAIPEQKPAQKVPFAKRARSVPYKTPYVVAIVATACFYLVLIGLAAALFSFFANPDRLAGLLLAIMIVSTVITWLASYLSRRQAFCPLCKGTPFLDSSAHCHEKAFRFFPLNYGSSNSIRSIACQHFRCQFCGTPFDLLKESTTRFGQSAPSRR